MAQVTARVARVSLRRATRRRFAAITCGGTGFDYLREILNSRVYDVALETPLDEAASLGARLGCDVRIKREDTQPVFSFKIRGSQIVGKVTIGRGYLRPNR